MVDVATSRSEMSKSQLRRVNKPLMEKKRRARINSSLVQLKSLVLDAMKKDSNRYSKLEKADILEMTVQHIRSIQQQQLSVAIATDPAVIDRYRAGFGECASEVGQYLGTIDGVSPDVRMRILQYLGGCIQKVDMTAHAQSFGQQQQQQPLQIQIPSATSYASLPGYITPPPEPVSVFPHSVSGSPVMPEQSPVHYRSHSQEGAVVLGTFQVIPSTGYGPMCTPVSQYSVGSSVRSSPVSSPDMSNSLPTAIDAHCVISTSPQLRQTVKIEQRVWRPW